MRWSSLRIRIGLWYVLLTLSCLSAFGLFLTVYLGGALEASRAPTMVHRAARAMAFVDNEHALYPSHSLRSILDSFLKASPEQDALIVRSADGKQTLFAGGGEPPLRGTPACTLPCFREFRFAGHHFRSYTESVVLADVPVQLTLAGTIDEHYSILRTVRTSYLLFVPFLLFASLSGGYLLSGRALQPVGRITAIASKLSISDLHGRVPVPRTGDELQTLAEAWNSMLARLQVSVERNAQFTSDASHDLRTSVAVMLAAAQLAMRKPRTPAEYAQTLRILMLECEHTLHLLENMLAAARAGFEQHELTPEPLQLDRMVRERCALFAAEAELKEQTLTLDMEEEVWISGDRPLLQRLIGVLVENAIKYTPRGGAVLVSLRGAEQGLRLQISDTGPGIAPANLSRIFGRAFRAQVTEATVPGSGLGLSIARWIAEAHQATLTVHSELGQGSVFSVEFHS